MSKPSTKCAHLTVACVALGLAHLAAAAEYRSAEQAAILYDGPSPRAAKVAIAPKGMPLEIVVNDANAPYLKVRERGGQMLWIERKALSEKRFLVVSAPTAPVRATADEAAAVVFQAEQDVALETLEAPVAAKVWVRVKHRDGLTGFVKISQTWGWQ